MKRKILSLILVFAMTVSLFAVGAGAAEPTYGDTAGHWAESAIERWSGHGIIQGSNGEFDPNGQLTCAQLATILAKLLKLPAATDAGFNDNTAGAWYYDAINRCAAAGILNGNGDGTVDPNGAISRERAMVMLGRALGIKPLENPDLTKFSDAAKVASYAQGMVAALIEKGIVGGVTSDTLAPQDDINRASTVTILDRAIGIYADKDGMTIDAKDAKLVLIVAKNVKVTNAPEGTEVVVIDGMSGLSVNGKSVSDDQTYIVPKETTSGATSGSSSGSSSHSYDATTHKCSCGQFDPAVVATIGNEKGYLTLAEAVAAAQNGDTVKLVKDITLAERVTANFSGTIDLNGRTLTSTTTCRNGSVFHVTSGTLTIKNGSMIGVPGPTGWTNELYEMECDAITVASGATVTLEGLSISICSRTGACVYVFDGGKAYVTSGTYSNDTTEFDANGTTKAMLLNQADSKPQAIFVSGGTFKGENPANGDNSHNPSTFLAAGYVATETSDGSGIWTVTEAPGKNFVAQVGNGKYETLAAAITAAQNGDTVTLLADVTASNIALKSGTLDLGGYTLDAAGATTNLGLRAANGIDVTIQNGTVKNAYSALTIWGSDDNSKPTKVTVAQDVTFTESTFGIIFTGYSADNVFTGKTGYAVLNFNGTITTGDGQCPIFVMGNLGNDNASAAAIGENGNQINIGATARITSEEEGIVLNGMAKLSVVDGATITGTDAITMKRGYLNITGGTFTGTGDKHVPTDAEHSGAEQSGSAITVSSTYNYSGLIDVKISGGTFNSTNSYGFYAGQSVENDNPIAFTNTSFAISGGNFSGGEAAVYFAAGKFITGGTFSSNPGAYVAAGYIALANDDDTFTVSDTDEIPVTTATVQDYLDSKYGSINGKTLVLAAGEYGTLYFRQSTESQPFTSGAIGGAANHVDAEKVTYDYHPGRTDVTYMRTFEDITIVGGENVIVKDIVFMDGNYKYAVDTEDALSGNTIYSEENTATNHGQDTDWHNRLISFFTIENLTFKGITFKGEQTALTMKNRANDPGLEEFNYRYTVDGLHFDGCKMVVPEHEGSDIMLLHIMRDNGQTTRYKNVSVKNCIIKADRVLVVDGIENLTITDNTFTNIKNRDLNFSQGSSLQTVTGNVLISGNTSTGSTERFVRIGDASGMNLTITGNVISDYRGTGNDYIKVTGNPLSYTISGNTATAQDTSRTLTINVNNQTVNQA